MSVLKIGEGSRDGVIQIVDTSWNSNGVLRVTVRELMGHNCWTISHEQLTRKMRDVAKRAIMYPEKTRSAKKVNEFVHGGCQHMTFDVSRLRD